MSAVIEDVPVQAGNPGEAAVLGDSGVDPVELLDALLRSWRLDPVSSQRLITSCLRSSVGNATLRRRLSRGLVSRGGRCAWQDIVDWYLATVSGAGFGSPSADRDAGEACLGFVTAIRDCIVETLASVSHRQFVNPFRRRAVALPLIVAARAVRCAVELSLLLSRPDVMKAILVLDWLLDRATARGVADYVNRDVSEAWNTSVNAEAGMSSLMARVDSTDLSTPAFASLLLALRGLSRRCIATQRPVEGVQFAVFFERGGVSFRPNRAGRLDPVSLYVGKGDLLAAVGGLLDSPTFLTWCEPATRPEIRALLLRQLGKSWDEGDTGRVHPRMRMLAPIRIVFGLEAAFGVLGGHGQPVSATMRDLSKNGAEIVVEDSIPPLEVGSFCAVSLGGEDKWYGALVRRCLPGRWTRDGKSVIGVEWVEGYLRAGLLASTAPSVLPFSIGWVDQGAEKRKLHQVLVSDSTHDGARAVRAAIVPSGQFSIGEPVQLTDGEEIHRYRVMSLICQMKNADWLRLVEWES